jgi:hypothetical protein
LILRQCFCGEEIECAGIWIGAEFSKNRQVVGKRFARGGAGGEDDVPACAGVCPCFELVGVEGVDAGGDQSLPNGSRQIGREGMRLCGARRKRLPGDKVGCSVTVTFPEMMWAAGTGALALVANKVNIRAFLDTFRESLLDKMLISSDVEHLGKWLDVNFGIWKPLISGLLIGPLLAWLLYGSWLENQRAAGWQVDFQAGVFTTIVLAGIQSIWVGYYLYPFYVAFPSRLHRYQFDLYAPDPSSSEVVGRLSRLLTYILYVTLAYIVQLTVGLTLLCRVSRMLSISPKLKYTNAAPRKSTTIKMNLRIVGNYTQTPANELAGVFC